MSSASGSVAEVPSAAAPQAVFMSYASEDAAVAEKICNALRAAGIEVWFDRSELRGGDAWDAAIRRQIKSCALFLPIISANTHARAEGYFRLEWKLAVDRSHLMAPDKPFLLPVAIDATPQSDERIPDRFRELHWTRLPGGETPPAFVERVKRLLSSEYAQSAAATAASTSGTTVPAPPRGAPAAQPAPASAARGTLRAFVWGLTLVAVVAIVTYSLSQWWVQRRAGEAPRATTATTGAEAIPEKSIAVLPFADMSEHKDQEYFSDGLAEELLDLLSQVPDLRVPARTSSFYFKGRSDDIAAIAAKLRVAHLLEGSVRRSGKHMRVTAQLIRADNGYHLWSKTYDRDVTDVFQVQDEIANAVVTALKAQLLSGQPFASRHRTNNTEAYTEYLLGNQLRDRDDRDSNRQALEAYRRAVALDPGYAAAWGGIAEAEWRITDQITSEAAGAQRSRAAAERAIALAPDSPDGYWARAVLRGTYDFDWTGAEADFTKALELDPNDVRALRDRGSLLATRGRNADALAAMRRSIALDPLSAVAWGRLGRLQLDLGQLTAAKESAQHLMILAPQSSYLTRLLVGQIALAEGRPADALVEFRKDNDVWKLLGSAMAEHSLGNAAASQAALDEVIREHAHTTAYQIAEVYAWRGERDTAFAWLERAYRQHDGGMTYLKHDHLLAPLRDDPRYPALLKKMNLV